ncbi:MAG: hypothetical protein IPI02_13180 [Sterolibacteriaceae bacterium]|nr:hypothetical protein [Sterolibacteriaceae bacterium]
MLVIDDQLLLIRFNEAAARLLRLGSEVLGKHFNRVELPSWAAELSRYVSAFRRRARVLRRNAFFAALLPYRRKTVRGLPR